MDHKPDNYFKKVNLVKIAIKRVHQESIKIGLPWWRRG